MIGFSVRVWEIVEGEAAFTIGCVGSIILVLIILGVTWNDSIVYYVNTESDRQWKGPLQNLECIRNWKQRNIMDLEMGK